MRTYNVSKQALIEKISENRDAHTAIVAAAQERYRERVIEELDRRLEDAKAGRKLDIRINLPIPTDYSQEYTNALAGLEWEIGDEIQLDEEDFNQLVLNQWHWAGQFAGTSLAYANNEI